MAKDGCRQIGIGTSTQIGIGMARGAAHRWGLASCQQVFLQEHQGCTIAYFLSGLPQFQLLFWGPMADIHTSPKIGVGMVPASVPTRTPGEVETRIQIGIGKCYYRNARGVQGCDHIVTVFFNDCDIACLRT